MQYNSEVFTYHRNKKAKEDDIGRLSLNRFEVKLIICFTFSLLISRVIMINSTAPFGIAFLMSILISTKKSVKFTCLAGSVIGYLTLQNSLANYYIYILIAVALTAVSLIIYKMSNTIKTVIFSTLILGIFIASNVILKKTSISMSILISILEILCVLPVYYITEYSIICFNNIKTKHLFNSGEIISMIGVVALVVSGAHGLAFYNISITNVAALLIIISISYISGFTIGSASGIVVGVIIGMATKNMSLYVMVFGVCGLISGMFKDASRWLAAIAFSVVFLIIIIYENNMDYLRPLEGIIASSIFFVLPNRIFNKLEEELNLKTKQDIISKNYMDKIKNIFIRRLDNFSGVLVSMSNILNNLADNDKLALKTKSSALVENLADRVCNSCNMKNICWKRELYYTYAAFEELISNYQDNKLKIPNEIERKCVKRNSLIKNTEDIVNNYIMNEMWRIRLSEGREVLANQINNIAGSIIEINKEFDSSINFNYAIESSIVSELNKKGIKFSDVMCLNNKFNRLIVKISMKACGGRQICVKEILPLINTISERCMCVCDDGCKIDPSTELCTIEFEETPKFHIASYVSRINKHGEKENGDSYSFGKENEENYMIIISDGMGSGANAGQESKATIDLIERFSESGLSEETAINCANSIMTLKFNEDEKFSTVDLCSVDLYSGYASFMKVGASASFIKRKDRVEVINSKTLPIGVLDKVDIEKTKKKLKNGDIIVMISDGVTDFNNNNAAKTDWVVDFLKNADGNNPKKLVEELVKKSVDMGKGKAKDDITAIVSKVYSLY
ncbi:stage II sporulation protein E [Clostridium acidisoli DSM 12555]|jgi:stage II sporulation protein E|uniref:Stage II sporulation protein E n=1 Tax=Clostridium acidisoli DSM 12555 TaxID=1121291 RepID=A0A1W1XYL2_9CLOT|nr:stage II sporulation protein E [Clostridium acidisoli]SMC28982.1 stage II sporulation protein E [Clostridium acidisoli DSM 12555]